MSPHTHRGVRQWDGGTVQFDEYLTSLCQEIATEVRNAVAMGAFRLAVANVVAVTSFNVGRALKAPSTPLGLLMKNMRANPG
jgi:hypothetical protein